MFYFQCRSSSVQGREKIWDFVNLKKRGINELERLYASFVSMFLIHFKKIVKLAHWLGTLGQKNHIINHEKHKFTFGGTLSIFSYNSQRDKINLAKYLIQAEQLFSFVTMKHSQILLELHIILIIIRSVKILLERKCSGLLKKRNKI